MSRTRDRVAALFAEGLSQAEIARRLNITPPAVCHHVRALGLQGDERFRRRYDWDAVQRYYDAGHSIADCMRRFGFAKQTWHDARRRGAVVPRPQAMPVEQLLAAPRNRAHLKARLLRLALKEHRCECCGLTRWRDAPLSLALHHVNGDPTDNRLGNLQLLCPNCHSQTANFAGRNARRRPPAA